MKPLDIIMHNSSEIEKKKPLPSFYFLFFFFFPIILMNGKKAFWSNETTLSKNINVFSFHDEDYLFYIYI